MALTKIKLGELIELSVENNSNLQYSLDDVKGISIKKMFIETKADMQGVSLKPYLVVKPDYFAYVTVTSRNGEKITLAHNDTNNTYIVSSSYVVFKVKRPDLLNSDYLFMYFNRPEFDRFSRFNSWGSARETFSWEDMCDIDFELPDLVTQQKYVDVYLSMIENQKAYERGLDDLKLVCDAYIEDLRRKMPCKEIGPYIEEINIKNDDEKIKYAIGISMNGVFDSVRTANKDSIKGCKIVEKDNILWASQTTCGIGLGAIGIYEKNIKAICAPTCTIIKTKKGLNPYYLLTWLRRSEFWRYAVFVGSGVVEKFDSFLMGEVKIPIPSVEIQESIKDIYKCYSERKEINEQLKNQINDICPILIKGSIEEGSNG